ncbi:hypothetical protein F8388_008970 [Cannabis sativa]|uniref:RNase H type-1 domain-containing protein n=1 Tax=Cannabis sativa TaxID=3483 RepID=A0A7J6GFW1_CANSA|nr:hypothetical protein F8388_008970 [Cannabis sativa]
MAGSGEGKSALDAELKAIGLALDWAVEMNWRNLIVFSDCKMTVDALQQRKVPDWRVAISFYNVMEKLKILLRGTVLLLLMTWLFKRGS